MRLLLDTQSLLYRAFFALPSTIRDADGRPVNAAYGYLDMTARLVRDRAPGEVVHVLDDEERPAPRVAAWPGYKAERAPEPDGFDRQRDLLLRALAACGQAVAHAPGWEADDAIAALVRPDAAGGPATDVVTGDRDLVQLVRDAPPPVRVCLTLRGVSELAELDEAAALARFGVPARRYGDLATLRGDPSDGLPGVPGVGEKTARALVQRHPDLDAVLAGAPGERPALARRLEDARHYLAAMRQVVPLRDDVEVLVHRPEPDGAARSALAEGTGIGGPLGRLAGALGLG